MAVAALAARHLCHAPQSREAYRHHSEGRSGRRRARCGSRHPPREGHLAPTSQEGAWRAQSPPQEAALTLDRAPAKTVGNFPICGRNTDSGRMGCKPERGIRAERAVAQATDDTLETNSPAGTRARNV